MPALEFARLAEEATRALLDALKRRVETGWMHGSRTALAAQKLSWSTASTAKVIVLGKAHSVKNKKLSTRGRDATEILTSSAEKGVAAGTDGPAAVNPEVAVAGLAP